MFSFAHLRDGIYRLRSNGYTPDTLHVGKDVYEQMKEDTNFQEPDEVGGEETIGQVASIDVEQADWVDRDAAVLEDSSSRAPDSAVTVIP